MCSLQQEQQSYLGAQEVQASTVSAQVDDGVGRTNEAQLIRITAGGNTVHLNTKGTGGGVGQRGGGGGLRQCAYRRFGWFVSPRRCRTNFVLVSVTPGNTVGHLQENALLGEFSLPVAAW